MENLNNLFKELSKEEKKDFYNFIENIYSENIGDLFYNLIEDGENSLKDIENLFKEYLKKWRVEK